MSHPWSCEHPRERHRLVGVESRRAPSRSRRSARSSACPAGQIARHASNTSSGNRARPSSDPAVRVVADVRHRRQERRQQVAVRAVQLEQIEPGRHSAPRGLLELERGPRPCRRASSPAAPGCAASRAAPTARSPASCRPAAARRSPPTSASSIPCARSARSGRRTRSRRAHARSRRSASRRRRARRTTSRRTRA